MKKLLILTCLLPLFSFAQGWYPGGGRSMSMANASVALTDEWSFFNNPGALGALDKFSAGLSYENRFLLKELQSQNAVAVVPLKVGVISVGGHHYGYRNFRSYKAGLGYSMQLSDRLFAGVQMNYQGIILSENYGSDGGVTAEAGVYAKITEKWTMGVAVFNIGRARLADYGDDRFSTIMRLGTAYKFSDKVLVSIEVDKDVEYPIRFKTGVDYQIADMFSLRGGFATGRVEGTFGFGLNFEMLTIDLGSSYDQILGWSPNFSISYHGKKK
jgi:hypothetical protein